MSLIDQNVKNCHCAATPAAALGTATATPAVATAVATPTVATAAATPAVATATAAATPDVAAEDEPAAPKNTWLGDSWFTTLPSLLACHC